MDGNEHHNKINEIKDRSSNRENLLENIIKKSDPIRNFPDPRNFLILARQWNSWYPSTLNVGGGCYLFNINKEIIIIDPGFKTLDVIKKNVLDIRLIRHIFITHFHPDHFESLTSLITRLSSEVNKLCIYLNSTSYNHFKIYSKDYTEFLELKPGMSIEIKFTTGENNFQIVVDVYKAFHREIGGSMNSIGLKFNLKDKIGTKFKIGFMSDTDGHEKYIDDYVKNFSDCHILIPHLGSIHKSPNGYKHLYKEGLERLLYKLEPKKNVIFLGEFGFELATEEKFKSVIKDLIPKKLSYNELISIILTFFNDANNVIKHPFIAQILGFLFSNFIDDVKIISPNLELFFPFIGYDNSVISQTECTFNNEKGLEIIKREIKDFKNKFEENQIIELWHTFYKKIVFYVESSSNAIQFFEDFFNKWNLLNLFEKFRRLINNFMGYIPVNSKISILRNTSLLARNYPIEKNIQLDQIINYISIDIDNDSSRFQGLDISIKEFFDSVEMKSLIFLIYGYFMLVLFQQSSFEMPVMEEKDGREIVCQYFREVSKHIILPVHPSYTIYFENEILIEGFTNLPNCSHKIKIPLSEINANYKIIPEDKSRDKKKEEFINVIPNDKCFECKRIEEERVEEMISQNNYNKQQIELEIEEIGEDIKKVNSKIQASENIYALFYIFEYVGNASSSPNDVSFNIDQNILLEKIKAFSKENDILTLKILIHPLLLRFEIVKKYIFNKLRELDKNQIKELFINSLCNKFPYMFEGDEDISPFYYELFDEIELVNLIEDKNVKLEILDILNLIDFFVQKHSRDINFTHRRSFIFFLKQFINEFYPLIEDPVNHLDDYKLIKENRKKILNLKYLGIPLINYQERILRNLNSIDLKNKL